MVEAIDPVEAFANILAGHGPLTEDEIVQRLQEAGATDFDFEELLDEVGDEAAPLIDDRWVWLPTLLAGRVLTHRVTVDELAHDILTATPDLDPILVRGGAGHFTDGAPVTVVLAGYDHGLLAHRRIPPEVVDHNGVLLLPAGTLGSLGVSEGELVGLRMTEQGLAAERVDAPAQAPTGERLAALLDDEPVDLDSVVRTLFHEDPAVFTAPQLPLSEIIDEYGLCRRTDLIAPAGFNFGAWDFERGRARLAYRYDLDPDDALAVYVLITMHRQMSTLVQAAPDDELVSPDESENSPWVADFSDISSEVGAVLADPELAEVLAGETVGTGRAGAAGLGLLAETLESKVPRPAQVACRWLRALALERIGDVEGAERELLAAESMDTDWAPVLFDLARFASDRGDVERGLSLLRRAGAAPDDPMVGLLERYQTQPRTDLGRNDACWCGSGRKYKKCHLGRQQLPLAERAGWLYAKGVQHALLGDWGSLLDEMVYERSRYAEHEDEIIAAGADPLVIDAVLFEGGAFEEFVAVRGPLLPDDERSLAEQWLLTGRSVFEVEQVNRGRGVTVRDVRTGDTHDVYEVKGSRELKPGQLICARVVAAGDTTQFFGGLEPVALHDRDPLIELLDDEPDPVELVAFLSRQFAPPTMVNTEGDPIAICQASVRVGDVAGIETALDDAFDRVDGEEPPRWHEHVISQGMERIRATLTLDGDNLRVETNSEKRMDDVLSTLVRLDPSAEVVDDTREAVGDLRELADRFPEVDTSPLDPDDPEVAAALDGFIREYEDNWLREPIPALNGYTPQQAADDPTRRGDLIKLLDSFPAGGAMDVDRLRAALGLG
ncbi:SEC-C metal-binding domain-containing protein [Mycobacterium sp. NPDC003449]